jgi:hypothetical protein
MTTLEIIILSAMLWLPAGVFVGIASERFRGHVRESERLHDRG